MATHSMVDNCEINSQCQTGTREEVLWADPAQRTAVCGFKRFSYGPLHLLPFTAPNHVQNAVLSQAFRKFLLVTMIENVSFNVTLVIKCLLATA